MSQYSEPPRPPRPTTYQELPPPIVTYVLIAINLAMYLVLELAGGPAGPFFVDQHPGMHPVLVLADLIQAGFDQLQGDKPAAANSRCRFGDGEWLKHQLPGR